MRDYRFYTLKDGNQIAAPPTVLPCSSDREAVAEAKKLLDGHDIEVWQGRTGGSPA